MPVFLLPQTMHCTTASSAVESSIKIPSHYNHTTYLDATVMCTRCKMVVIKRRPINAVDFAHVTGYVVDSRRSLLHMFK